MNKINRLVVWTFVLGVLGLFGCQTSDIAVNKKALAKVKTIAVLSFDRSPGIEENAAIEAEETLQSALVKAGYLVLERQKIMEIMKEKELGASMGDVKAAENLGQVLGADAVLFGKVTQNRTYRKTVIDQETTLAYETDVFEYQVQVRLTSTADGTMILTMKNLYNIHENDPKYIPVSSLESFRSQILNDMGSELYEALAPK